MAGGGAGHTPTKAAHLTLCRQSGTLPAFGKSWLLRSAKIEVLMVHAPHLYERPCEMVSVSRLATHSL
ncbi:MAG: hypothetical protein ACI841_003237, partial [Planctomycetota bacterium]